MYLQHPDYLVLAADERRRALLASAERVRPVPASSIGPGYPPQVAKAVWRLLDRIVGGRRVEAQPAGDAPRGLPAELAG